MTTAKNFNKGRLNYIDVAKGISIICIILGHLDNWPIIRVVFTFHVPIFYFISGYFVNEKGSVGDYVKKRIKTLLVPYAVTCLVIILLGTMRGFLTGNPMDEFKKWIFASLYGAGDSYTEPFTIYPIGALWFLWATFWGNCFLKLALGMNQYVRLLWIILLFCVGYYSCRIFWFPLSIQSGACATLFMYIGYLVKRGKNQLSSLSQEAKIAGSVFAIVTAAFFVRDFKSFWLVHCDFGRGIIDIFACVCACWIVLLIAKFIDLKMVRVRRVLSYLGQYSLLVLSIHIIELNLFPWWGLAAKYLQPIMPYYVMLLFIITGKMIMDLFGAYLLSKIGLVRKVFGYIAIKNVNFP